MEGNKIKHLEMIQSIISRLAGNSFVLKGGMITIFTAILAVLGKDFNLKTALVLFIPIIAFWMLDSYYLFKERLFRSLYDRVRTVDDKNIDFGMDISSKDLQKNDNTYFKCFLSITELYFYLPFIGLTIIFLVIKEYDYIRMFLRLKS